MISEYEKLICEPSLAMGASLTVCQAVINRIFKIKKMHNYIIQAQSEIHQDHVKFLMASISTENE